MATIASLVVQFLADTGGIVTGLNKVDQSLAKFQKSLVGKAFSAAAVVQTITKAARGAEQAFRDMAENGTPPLDALRKALGNVLTSLPVAGDFAAAAVAFRDWVTGDMELLRQLEAEQAKWEDRLRRSNDVLRDRTSAQEAYKRSIADNSAELAQVALQEEMARLEREIADQKALNIALDAAVNNAIRGLIRPLEDQLLQLQLGEEGWLRYRLALVGASEETQQYAVDLMRQIELIKQQQRAAEEAAQAEQRAADAARRAQEDMQREAEALWERTRTPLERYNQELERMKKLLDAGLITEETFQRGVADAAKQLEGMADSAAPSQTVERRRVLGFRGGDPSENIPRLMLQTEKKQTTIMGELPPLLRDLITITKDNRLEIISA